VRCELLPLRETKLTRGCADVNGFPRRGSWHRWLDPAYAPAIDTMETP